ncbi:MAG: M24 family metallopeptidase [Planctomycetota bacterium]
MSIAARTASDVERTAEATSLPSPRDLTPRRAEVENRQEIIAQWLRQEQQEAVFLFDPDNIAWFSAGGDLGSQTGLGSPPGFLFVTPRQRCLISSNEHTDRIFERELDGLGFQSKQFSWTRPVEEIIGDLRGGRAIFSDQPGRGLVDRSATLATLRRKLTAFDQARYRTLAAHVSHAVEATCRSIRLGELEWEVAAHLAHRLLHHGIEPVDIHILSTTNPHPRPRMSPNAVDKGCSILVTGRTHGLYFTTARTMSFGPPDKTQADAHRIATLVAGTFLRFSLPGESIGEVFRKGMRIYQKFGAEFAWMDSPQGSLTGYSRSFGSFLPTSEEHLEPGMTVCWHPLVNGSVSADALIVGEGESDPLLYCEDWPTVGVDIQGVVVPRPDILIRES